MRETHLANVSRRYHPQRSTIIFCNIVPYPLSRWCIVTGILSNQAGGSTGSLIFWRLVLDRASSRRTDSALPQHLSLQARAAAYSILNISCKWGIWNIRSIHKHSMFKFYKKSWKNKLVFPFVKLRNICFNIKILKIESCISSSWLLLQSPIF